MAYLHVATTGADTAPGDSSAPWRTPQKAAKTTRPGDTTLIHGGTYNGQVDFTTNGQPDAPIVFKAAGDGPSMLRVPISTSPVRGKSFAPANYKGMAPTLDRTLRVMADHVHLIGLHVEQGVLLNGRGSVPNDVAIKDHTLPGLGENPDPEAHETAFVPALAKRGWTVDMARGIELDGLKVTRRGIYARLAPHHRIVNCEVSNIDGGTGGGMWIGLASSFGYIGSNRVHDLGASFYHHMTECIRIATMSSYGVVENNLTEDAAHLGRGVNTDANANHMTIRGNTARRMNRGMSNQKECWGNKWLENLIEDSRQYAFTVGDFTHRLEMSCNEARRSAVRDLFVTYAEDSIWLANGFRSVGFAYDVERPTGRILFQPRFGALGNTYEGRTTVPTAADNMDVSAFNACGAPIGSSLG